MELKDIITDILVPFSDKTNNKTTENIDNALKSIGETAQLDGCYLAAYNNSNSKTSWLNEWIALEIKSEINATGEISVAQLPWLNKKILSEEEINLESLNDLPGEAEKEKEYFNDLKIKSILVIPVFYSDKVIGFLRFDSIRKPKKWTDAEIVLLRLVADVLGIAVHKCIKHTEDFKLSLKSLFDNKKSAVLVTDKDGKYLFGNKEVLSHWNLTESEFYNTSVHDYFPKEISEVLMRGIHEVIKTGKDIYREMPLIINKEMMWFRNNVTPIVEEGKPVDKVLITSEDINAQKANELKMDRLNRRIKGLHQINRALLHQFTSGDDIIKVALDHLYEMVPAMVITFSQINLKSGFVKVSDNYLLRGTYVDRDFSGFHLKDFDTEEVENLLNHRTSVKRYENYNINLPYQKLLKEIGIRSSIYIPLAIDKEELGVIVLQSEELDFFTDEYVDIVEEVVRELQVGINQQQMYQQIQHYNKELETLVEERTKENIELNFYNSLIVESTGVAIMTVDNTNKFTQLNPKAEMLLGINTNEALNLEPFSTCLSEKERLRILEFTKKQAGLSFNTALEAIDYLTRNASEVELKLRHKDGTETPVLMNIAHIYDGDKLKYRIVVAVDITERLEAEERLRSSEARWHTAVENSGDGIWDWNVETDEVFYSEQTKSMIGYHNNEIKEIASDWYNRIHPDDLDQVDKQVSYYMNGEMPIYIAEYRIRCKNGNYKWIMDRGKAISFDENGKPSRLVGTHTDISARKEYEQSLLDALNKEKELSELKSQFVSMTSHEFRTPLASILMTADSLELYFEKTELSEINPERIKNKIRRIRNNIDFLKNILEKVLSLSHLESGKLSFAAEQINLNKEIYHIVEDYKSGDLNNHEIKIDSSSENVEMYADKQMIRQVISNIIANASKYSPDEMPIEIKISNFENSVELSFKDYGIGIKAHELNEIFQPFKRGTNVGNIHGTGLGLALSKEFVKRHGGTIDVESEIGKGTLFVVRLPKVPVGKMG